MKRAIIEINDEKCTGCGLCIPNCPEGAMQIIDGKARLVSDLLCDGLGACLGHCPEGALSVVEREAEDYDERKVMASIARQGTNTIHAHLAHLKDHGQMDFFNQAVSFLKENNIPLPEEKKEVAMHAHEGGCPGARTMSFAGPEEGAGAEPAQSKRQSQLTHWPVQLHLINPSAPHFHGADLLLAADCTAFALGDFHRDFLKGRKLTIACPKLDENQEVYTAKIQSLIDEAKINTLTVMIMQVPCCGGLLHLARTAAQQASRKVPIKCITVGIKGDILKEEWV